MKLFSVKCSHHIFAIEAESLQFATEKLSDVLDKKYGTWAKVHLFFNDFSENECTLHLIDCATNEVNATYFIERLEMLDDM